MASPKNDIGRWNIIGWYRKENKDQGDKVKWHQN